jgi:hypothetical protein
MRIILKILKVITILIITFTISLFSASLFFQEKVADIILKSINNNITTIIHIGSFRLTFLRKFPKASLELKDVLVHSSPSFDITAFPGINTDTLLAARSVSVEFSVRDIINGNYSIDRIGIKSGKLFLLSDTSGNVNYEIKTKNKTATNTKFELNLERITLSEVSASYCNLATKLSIKGVIENGRLKSKIQEDNIEFSANSSLQITLFQLYNTIITNLIHAEIDINLSSSENETIFRKGILKLDDLVFGLSGKVSKDYVFDLDVTGQNISISSIRKYLPHNLRLALSDYDPSGVLRLNGRVEGALSRTKTPHIEINTILDHGHIKYGISDLSVDDLSFTGFFSNGTKNLPETSSISVNNISLKLGSSKYSGSFSLANFDNPETLIILNGTFKPAELKEFFDLQNISHTEGSIDLKLKLSGKVFRKEKYLITDLFELNPIADINFHSFSLGMKNNNFSIDHVNGNLYVSDKVIADNLQLVYRDHKIKVDGDFTNLPGWITGESAQMTVSANVKINKFDPIRLFWNAARSTEKPGKRSFTMPEDLILDLNFDIDTLLYKTFQAEKIRGTLSYKPGILNIKSVNMNSLDGTISGNGYFAQNIDMSLIGKGAFSLEGINIKNAFTTFNDFGQNFLKAENLSGTLSGSLSLLLPLDSLLKPQIKLLTAEGRYLVTKGTLINFDPVKSLSSYIELSELENISFETLENDFFIRNNFLYIPQMDVKSSAVDLTVNGKHSFDNNYEYHVKMLLSEILSKKIKKNRSNQSEFGIIEDDGLGRTSIFLKIENKGEDVKVGYDLKATGNKIKKEIKTERQSLKTILNEEYGWYKNDSSLQKKEEKRPRFRITWDEKGDSVKTLPEIPPEKKSNPIKNLFKKK